MKNLWTDRITLIPINRPEIPGIYNDKANLAIILRNIYNRHNDA